MPNAQQLDSQRDFSAGELDTQAKRRDDLPIMRAGARQMSNWRVLNSGVIEQRPGRAALFTQVAPSRVDEIQVAPGVVYRLCFGGDGSFLIRDATGDVQAQNYGYPWNGMTLSQIVWTTVKVDVGTIDAVVCFQGSRINLARYSSGAWTFPAFSFALDSLNVQLVPFYRIAAPGATMLPDNTAAAGGVVNLVMSAPVFVAAHVGTQFRFAGQRMTITAVTDSEHAAATAVDQMMPTQQLTIGATTGFEIGQEIEGSTTSCKGVIVGINSGGPYLNVQVLNFISGFGSTEKIVGPTGQDTISAISPISPLPCTVWDEQMVSDARGWPQSCNSDRGRLILCDLPSSPEAIMWSGLGSPYDFSVGTGLGTDAIIELMAGKPRVYHVGAWYDELIFTDKGIWYVPIGISTTLAPGTVSFLPVSNEAAGPAKPAFASEGFLYVNAGQNRINLLIGTGAAFSTKPYIIQDITMYHTHLFAAGPIGIAVATGDGTFPERYVYVTMKDGSVNTGRFEPRKDFSLGESSSHWVGWIPWNVGAAPGFINWISTLFSDVIFSMTYPGAVYLIEALDDSKFLDAAIFINVPPSQLTPGAGQGPLYWMPNGTVDLVDGSTSLGTFGIDAKGHIVPITNAEDFSSPTLTAGLSYQPMFEPFVPNAEPGQDGKQRTRRRRIPRMMATVENSSGFLFAKLYSGPIGTLLPSPGTIMGERRVTAWNQDDNQDGPPVPLREQTYSYRPTGRAYDPRVAIIKDVPGPLRLVEIGLEATV